MQPSPFGGSGSESGEGSRGNGPCRVTAAATWSPYGVAPEQSLGQLDDDAVARLDDPAERLHVSRSKLPRGAALALLETDRIAEAERATIAAHRQQPQAPSWMATASQSAAKPAPRR